MVPNPHTCKEPPTAGTWTQGDAHHDQIGVASVPLAQFDGVTFDDHPSNPVITVGPAGYDAIHVLDPGAVWFRGKVYVYYTAHGVDTSGQGVSGIGVAVSDDGFSFSKPLEEAVLPGALAPDVVVREGRLWLVYARDNRQGQWEFYVNSTDDPLHVDPTTEIMVMSPSAEHAWEARSIMTPRIFEQGGFYYMTYVGSSSHQDYGFTMGLARSRDFLTWERYPMNPIFRRADGATWDNAAIWFGTLFRKGATQDLIDQTIDPADSLLQFQNVSNVKARGVEVELDLHPKMGLRGYANYVFQRAEDPDAKKKLTNSPQHSLKIGLACPVVKQVYAAAELQYESERITIYRLYLLTMKSGS